MGPPGFSECYICHREFGSRSLEIHEPQCLARWRRDNNNLSKGDRQKTPSPPSNHYSLHSDRLEDKSPSAKSSQESSPDGSKRKERPNSSTFMERRKLSRPSTATLNKPKVLDPRMKNEIDMSEMSRQMMERLVLQTDQQKGSSDYSSDFSSSSSSSRSRKSPCEDDPTSGDSESDSKKRPSTMRLKRPSSNISVPVITHSSTRPLPRRGRTATIRSKLPLSKRLLLTEDILGTKDKVKIPEPCLTCGKEQNPERFHSHPRHLSKFKAKDKLSKDRNNVEIPYKSISKLAVTKPTALKYKSKSFESTSSGSPRPEVQKGVDKRSNVKSKGKTKSKSAENSPRRKVPTETLPKGKIERKTKTKRKDKNGDESDDVNASSNGLYCISRPLKNFPKPKKAPESKNENDGKLCMMNGTTTTVAKAIKPSTVPVERVGTAPLKLCYICCREFGSRSLGIHEPQCLEKWKRENDRLPDHLKREEPKRPEKELSKEEWNEYAWNMAQSQLVPCENCGRTFKPDRLEVHQRGCKPPPGSKKLQERKGTASPKHFFRPTIVCYICGREFGSKSIAIHEPQCLAKWKNENDKLPQHLQRPEPMKPETVVDEEGRIDRQAMAEAAWRSHLETLVKCEGCDRTFFPDRLAVHQKLCKVLNS